MFRMMLPKDHVKLQLYAYDEIASLKCITNDAFVAEYSSCPLVVNKRVTS